jgi:hypothetical protein
MKAGIEFQNPFVPRGIAWEKRHGAEIPREQCAMVSVA